MEMQSVSTESFLGRNDENETEHHHQHEFQHNTHSGTEHEDGSEHQINRDEAGEAPPYLPDEEDGEALPPYERRNENDRLRSTPLHQSWWMLIPTAVYAAMAIYSWFEFCHLSRTGDIVNNKNNTNVVQYKAARILHVIVAVATVPMISTVCAWAGAVYVQNQRDAYSLRLRQVMMIADRTWMNPLTLWRLVFSDSGFKRYGSGFLYIAMFSFLLGVVTYPVQSLFLLGTRKVYVEPLNEYGYVDWPLGWQEVKTVSNMVSSGYFAAGESILDVRRQLQTSSIDMQFPQLWGNTDSLSSVGSVMNQTWFAQLSNTFSTGPFGGQYLPRVNSSTAMVLNLTAGEFPSDCSKETDWFYALYSYAGTVSEYNSTLEVCLAVNGSTSPWNATNGRQDFTEVLYLNASNVDDYGVGAVKVVMNTTAGFFELPSIGNNRRPGPLNNSATGCVGYDCGTGTTLTRRAGFFNVFEPTMPGPLTVIALAMFGPGSWADTQQNVTVTGDEFNNETGWQQYLDSYMAFDDVLPLVPLMSGFFSKPGNMDSWLAALTSPRDETAPYLSAAFTRASFLATKAIFDAGEEYVAEVQYNTSAIQQITLPALSTGGLIVGSVLLGLYMMPLLGLALYAAYSARWTTSLDAFTMLRMGAAFGQKDLPLLLGFRTTKIQALDDLPGVIRDVSGPEDKIRQLALGVEGGASLRTGQRYLAYPGNNDLFSRERSGGQHRRTPNHVYR